MSDDFQAITIIANPERDEARDGSRSHAKKFPFRLSSSPSPEWVALFTREWAMRTVANREATVHGDILGLECAIEELPILAENLEIDMSTANQRYRSRLQRQIVHEERAGREAQVQERIDDNSAMDEAIGKLRKRF